MKVSALIFLCIVATVAVAIPVQPEYGADTQLTLADLENEQKELNQIEAFNNESQSVAREKRYIFLLKKKLALAKLAHLGLG